MAQSTFEIKKAGRKWKVGEYRDEWLFRKVFNRKWKAEIAVDVYKTGGGWKDYCARISNEPSHRLEPAHALKLIKKINGEIAKLSPTCKEMTSYAEYLYKTGSDYGVVTITNGDDYFQRVHDTWYANLKKDGRVNIDLGCNGYHLMLTRKTGYGFISFVRSGRTATQ